MSINAMEKSDVLRLVCIAMLALGVVGCSRYPTAPKLPKFSAKLEMEIIGVHEPRSSTLTPMRPRTISIIQAAARPSRSLLG